MNLVLRVLLAFAAFTCGVSCDRSPAHDAQLVDAGVGVTSSALSSSPDPQCAVATFQGHEYWFCRQLRNWSAARTRCLSQPGMDLARVDSAAENAFIFSNTPIDAWIGASDTVEGAWKWSNNGDQFWNGGVFGSPVAGRYANWKAGQPDNWFNQDCAAMELFASGKWADRLCSELLEFVCERPLAVGEAEVSCALTGALEDAPWPGFRRCPTHQGASPLIGAQDSEPSFSYETDGDVESSPAIAENGMIYVGSYDGYLYALNPDLSFAWRYQTFGMIRSSPAIGPDGTIYVGSNDGFVHAVSPTGSHKWSYPTLSPVRSSPAIGPNNRIYVGSDNSRFYALNATTGAKIWDVDTLAAVRSTAAISPDGTIYIGFEDWQVVALNPDGSEKWSYPTLGPVTSSPAIGPDGTVYVGCYDGFLYALHPGSGTLKWSYEVGAPITSSPAIASDGTIVFGSDDKFVRVLEPDGDFKWEYETGDLVISSPAIGADGIVYVGSRDAFVYALDLANGDVVWTFGTDGEVESSPAIGADGKVYFGSDDDKLYAVGPGCSPSRPCENGKGPCMTNADCEDGLTCGFGIAHRFGLPEGAGVCWDPRECAKLDPDDCGDPDDLCGSECCVPSCGAAGTDDGCGHECLPCVPGADTDGDTIPDCDEQNDDDDWTNPQVFNGAEASQGDSCHATPSCGLINTRAEIDACFVPQESQLLASGWDFSTTDQDLCDPGFGFEPEWEECRDDFAIRYQASVRLLGMGRHCFQLEGSTTNQCASMFIGATAITTGAPVCMTLAGGTYGIEWFYETTNNGTSSLHIEHCFGGATDCVPTDPIDPADMLPPGELPSCAPNCPAETCGNSVLDLGEACDTGLTPFCSPDCSTTSSPGPCRSDSDCTDAQTCGLGNGAALNQDPTLSYCWPRFPCALNSSLSCGTPESACGACQCAPDCAGKVCGDDPSDGCNGFCSGLCDAGEPGCRLDTDCPSGHVCGVDVGPRYGLASGVNVCIRSDVDYVVASTFDCGSYSDPGGLCLINPNPPPADLSCSPSCGANQYCAADGVCVAKDATVEPDNLENAVPDLPTAEVGTLSGSFAVSDVGAAQYRIPIEVPPGRAGVQPELALQYDSSSGNSMIGRGWSLTGLPAVTRCARNVATDGVAVGVLATAEDAYCLGADRLVPINGGLPGAEGTEYRTELDSFTKVISYGSGTAPDGTYTGPTYFRAWTKAGRILSFGENPDGRRVSDGVNLVWYVTNISDHHGNGMTVTYDRWIHGYPSDAFSETTGTDQVNPTAIYYTQGHGSAGSRKVVLVYGTPSNHGGVILPRRFMAGAPFLTTSTLLRIETYVEGELVRTYKLNPRLVGTDVLLNSIQACVPSSEGERCLTPTVFTYDESPLLTAERAGLESVGYWAAGTGWQPGANAVAASDPQRVLGGQTLVLDADGDGDQDLMQGVPTNEGGTKHRWTLRTSEGSVSSTGGFLGYPRQVTVVGEDGVSNHTEEFQRCHSFKVFDFNEDGVDDLYGQCPIPSSLQPSRGPRYIFRNDAEAYFTRILVDDPPFASNHPSMATMLHDLDADGRLDYVLIHGTATCTGDGFGNPVCPLSPYHILWRRNRGPAFVGDQLAPLAEVFATERYAEGDYDGNGSPDLLVRAPDGRSAILKVDAAGVPRLSFGLTLAQLPLPDPASDNLWPALPPAYAAVGPIRLDANGDGVQDSFGWMPGRFDFDPGTQMLYFGLSTASSVKRSQLALDLIEYYIVGGGRTELGAPEYKAYSSPMMFVMDRDSDGRDEIYIAPARAGAVAEGDYWRRHDPLGPGNLWTTAASDIPWLQPGVDPRQIEDGFGNVFIDDTRYVAAWQNWQRPVVMDFDGDGAADLVSRNGDQQAPYMEVRRTLSRTRHRMIGVRNGLGENVEVEYDFAPDGSRVYTNTHGACDHPKRCLKSPPDLLVAAHTVSGNGGPYLDPSDAQPAINYRRFEYRYRNGRADVLGRGFLGFQRREMTEQVPAADGSPSWTTIGTTHYVYDLDAYDAGLRMHWRAGKPVTVAQVREIQGHELTDMLPTQRVDVQTFELQLLTSEAGRPYVATSRVSSSVFENEYLISSRLDHTTAFDGFGNPRQHITDWGDGRSVTTDITYDPRPEFRSAWQVKLPLQVTITGSPSANPAPSDLKRVQVNTTHDARGLPETVIRSGSVGTDPMAIDLISITEFDVHGNPIELLQGAVAAGPGEDPPPDRRTFLQYDAEGYFPALLENEVHRDQSLPGTSLDHDPRNGQVRYRLHPGGDWEGFEYDGFGRLAWQRDMAGRTTTMEHSTGAIAGGPIQVRIRGTAIPDRTIEYNAFAQPILERTTLVGGRQTHTELAYDHRGLLVTEGVPHLFTDPSPGATRHRYDTLGRRIETEYPWQHADGTASVGVTRHLYASSAHASANADVHTYLGLTNVRTLHMVQNGAGHSTVETQDMRGNVTATFDAHGFPAIHVYGAFDHHRYTYFQGIGGVVDSDEHGRTTRYADPDRGVYEYRYNGFGDLTTTVRNPGGPSEQVSTNEFDGLGRVVGTTTPDGLYAWEWDGDGTDPSDLGKVVAEEVQSSSIGSTRTEYSYEGPGGAVSETRRRIRGTWFTTSIDYHPTLALPEVVSYPTSVGTPLAVRYGYDAGGLGQVTEVRDASTDDLFWELGDVDAFGGIEEATTGDLVTTRYTRERRTGSMSRIEARRSPTALVSDETFAYDVRGLIARRSTARTSGMIPQEYFHDELGRLRTHIAPAVLISYDYDDHGNLTEAPTVGTLSYTIPGRPHAVSMTTDGRSFGYDAFGNQTLRDGPDGRQELDYTAFDLPAELREGPDDAPTRTTRFDYDVNNARIVRESDDGLTTTYVGDLYREEHTAATDTTERIAVVMLPDGRALNVDLDESDPQDRYRYEHIDHQGSVVALTDGAATKVEDRQYLAFGTPVPSHLEPVRAGFTGHEHDREQALINMRGRLYDPAIGRFLTPDPVRNRASTQALNPYSYVLNAPLNLVDPSGFEPAMGLGEYNDPGTMYVWGNRPDTIDTMSFFNQMWQQFGAGTWFDSWQGGALETVQPQRHEAASPQLLALANGVMTGVRRTVAEIAVQGAIQAAGGPVLRVAAATLGAVAAPIIAVVQRAMPAAARGAAQAVVAMVQRVMPASRAGARVAEAAPVLSRQVDDLATYGARVPTQSGGYFNVVTHADATSAYVRSAGGDMAVGHRELARFISGSSGYSGQPIRLIGCNAGACSTGLAQNLANKLGVDVVAPTGKAYVSSTGSFWADGSWVTFTPR
jgi:RHS repeat-associated protein